MPRTKEEFTIFLRNKKSGKLLGSGKKQKKVYYYRLGGDPQRKARSTGKSLKSEADRFVKKLLANRQKASVPTLREYAKDFFIWDRCNYVRMKIRKRGSIYRHYINSLRYYLENYFFNKIGDVPLDRLNVKKIEEDLFHLEASNRTINNMILSLNIVLKEAIRDKIINENPISNINRPSKAVTKKRDTFTCEEIKQIFPSDEEQLIEIWKEYKYAVLFKLLLTRGMRSGELRALRWKHFYAEYQGIVIENAVKSEGHIGGVKTSSCEKSFSRVVIIPKNVTQMLLQLKELSDVANDDQFCFSDLQPILKERMSRIFKRTLLKTEIAKSGKNLVIHSLRHTFNTILRSKMPPYVIAVFMGHSYYKMAEHYYNPTISDLLKDMAKWKNKIDKIWDF